MLYNSLMNILGVNISELSFSELILKIREFLTDAGQHYIVTPNPEIILAAHADEEFFYVLNQADLAIADGFGLKIAAALMGKKLNRISGSDLSPEIIKIAQNLKYKIAIINWNEGLSSSQQITSALNAKYPGLEFVIISTERKSFLSVEELEILNNFKPQILFSALGAPYQEKIIYHNLKKIPSLKLALGVGGSFDFMTGRAKRAPKFFRTIGLEWFWRLLKQPKRIKRIYRATFVFLEKIFNWLVIQPLSYRPNVVCWLYKHENEKYKILLVERSEELEHWQLPQGGTDGESLSVAGARELREETGNDKFTVQATYKNLYRYRVPRTIQGNVTIRDKYGYIGQKQGLCLAEFNGQDSDIKISFWDHTAWKWVELDNLISSLHPIRKEGAEIFLKKFQEYINNK